MVLEPRLLRPFSQTYDHLVAHWGHLLRLKRDPSLAFGIHYSPAAEDHLRVLTAGQRRVVLDAVDAQLAHQPTVETRRRKPMRPNPLAPWELRVGNLRVYYDVEEIQDGDESVVVVLAVGVKRRKSVRIGMEDIQL